MRAEIKFNNKTFIADFIRDEWWESYGSVDFVMCFRTYQQKQNFLNHYNETAEYCRMATVDSYVFDNCYFYSVDDTRMVKCHCDKTDIVSYTPNFNKCPF